MNLSPQNSTAPTTAKAAEVVIENIHKSFDGHRVLNGVDLRIAPRENCIIMGPSGCGKTVLLRHIMGLEKPDQGRVTVNQLDVAHPQTRHLLNLAMVFQSSALFNSMTVGENVALWLQEHQPEMDEAQIESIVMEKLTLLGVEEAINKLPSDLSGGMRKRVAIARALVMNPNLILYDEPTGELDPIRSVGIATIIHNLRAQIDTTSIVVTHDRDLAFTVADRIVMFAEGRVIESGTPDQIWKSTHPVVQQFLTAGHKPIGNQIIKEE
jgi:phospholipid/cholesterol/gamma-HCH transport system ATP-binding protein